MPGEQQRSREISVKPPTSSKDFQNPIYDEWKRKAVDEAKKRAVGQAVDYETFKNLVSVAHLRPIGDPSCKQDNISTPAARLGRDGQVLQFNCSMQASPVSITSGKLPTTTAEFHREWKRNRTTNRSRYELLCQLEVSSLLQIFQVEMDSMVLSGIITACEDCWRADENSLDGVSESSVCGNENQRTLPSVDRNMIVEKLHAVVQSKGFPMASKLLSSRTRESLHSLINRLIEACRSTGSSEIMDNKRVLSDIHDIANRFGVQVSVDSTEDK